MVAFARTHESGSFFIMQHGQEIGDEISMSIPHYPPTHYNSMLSEWDRLIRRRAKSNKSCNCLSQSIISEKSPLLLLLERRTKKNSFYLTNSLVICSLDTGCSESCSIRSNITRHIQSVGTKQVIGHVERVHSQSSRNSFLILQHPLFFLPSSFISTANDDEYLTFAEILEPDNQTLVNNVNNLVRFRPTDSGRLSLCSCKIVLRVHTREARRCIFQPSPISRRKYPATMFFLCITHKFTQYKYKSREK